MRALVLAIVLMVACKKGQSFHDGVQALCDLPDHVPPPTDSYEKRLAGVATWADANITNADAKKVGAFSKDLSKQSLADAVKKADIAHCKLLDNDLALQSFADAMTALCAAPSERDKMGPYFKSHLLNPDVIRLFSALGEANPEDQHAKMQAALDQAGIKSCALLDAMAKPQP